MFAVHNYMILQISINVKQVDTTDPTVLFCVSAFQHEALLLAQSHKVTKPSPDSVANNVEALFLFCASASQRLSFSAPLRLSVSLFCPKAFFVSLRLCARHFGFFFCLRLRARFFSCCFSLSVRRSSATSARKRAVSAVRVRCVCTLR